MPQPVLVPIDDASRVAEVRRVAMGFAKEQGLGEETVAKVGIVATETATNLVKHAQQAEVLVSNLTLQGQTGVEILAIDRGPGVENLEQCLADGYSTTGTTGTGMGAISRLANEFDAYSQPGRGTVLVARVHEGPAAQRTATCGAVIVPFRGEPVCGDAWALRQVDQTAELLVADGLGHGVLAADASGAAARAFSMYGGGSPGEMVERLHEALRGTRGAALAVARIDAPGRCVQYAGIGNIAGAVVSNEKTQFMVSHNGTAGHAARRFQQFEYALPPDGVVIMHSDGLSSSWNFKTYPGLLRRHPSVIAGVLYRDASRGRDDVCVVVWRSLAA